MATSSATAISLTPFQTKFAYTILGDAKPGVSSVLFQEGGSNHPITHFDFVNSQSNTVHFKTDEYSSELALDNSAFAYLPGGRPFIVTVAQNGLHAFSPDTLKSVTPYFADKHHAATTWHASPYRLSSLFTTFGFLSGYDCTAGAPVDIIFNPATKNLFTSCRLTAGNNYIWGFKVNGDQGAIPFTHASGTVSIPAGSGVQFNHHPAPGSVGVALYKTDPEHLYKLTTTFNWNSTMLPVSSDAVIRLREVDDFYYRDTSTLQIPRVYLAASGSKTMDVYFGAQPNMNAVGGFLDLYEVNPAGPRSLNVTNLQLSRLSDLGALKADGSNIASWNLRTSQGNWLFGPGTYFDGQSKPSTWQYIPGNGIRLGIDHFGSISTEVALPAPKLAAGAYRVSIMAQVWPNYDRLERAPAIRAQLRSWPDPSQFVSVQELLGAGTSTDAKNMELAPVAYNKSFILTVPATTTQATTTLLAIHLIDTIEDQTPNRVEWTMDLKEVRIDKIY